MEAASNSSKFRLNVEKQESLVKLGILTIAAILCNVYYYKNWKKNIKIIML